MKCDEFEQILQQQADGGSIEHQDAALRVHAQGCRACRELEEGFRLFSQSFAVSRVPAPAQDLTERILTAVQAKKTIRPRWLSPAVYFAAAASLVLAVRLWPSHLGERGDEGSMLAHHAPLTIHYASNDEPLFPDAQGSDSRDSVVLIDAVEPVSQIFRAVGHSIGSPVRPIAITASEALGNLIKDLPDPDSTMMSVPGMREIMPQPMKKKMGELRPLSGSS